MIKTRREPSVFIAYVSVIYVAKELKSKDYIRTYTEQHPSNSSFIISSSNPSLDGKQ